MDALPARHQLTRLQSDALLSLSEQLVQLERRFDMQGIVCDDSRLQEAVKAVVAEQVTLFAHRIEVMEALVQEVAAFTGRLEAMEAKSQRHETILGRLERHTGLPVDMETFLAKCRGD